MLDSFNVFKRLNGYLNIFIKNSKRRSYSFSSQFYSTSIVSILSSSEEEKSPVKGRAFKAQMKDKEKQEKAKMFQEVADDEMAEGKDNTKEKKDITSNGKGAKDWKEDEVSVLIELLEERLSLWDVRETAYKEIADVSGCNITSIKSKINGLRAQYGCEMAKVNKTKSGKSTDKIYVSN